MRNSYDFGKMKARRNPYASRLKKQITIRIGSDTIDYFKKMAEETGIPYQNLIDSYLAEKLSALKTAEYLAERAKRAPGRRRYEQLLGKVLAAKPARQDRFWTRAATSATTAHCSHAQGTQAASDTEGNTGTDG